MAATNFDKLHNTNLNGDKICNIYKCLSRICIFILMISF